jgi:GDP-L-fucose synthase
MSADRTRVLVAGAETMTGAAIVRRFAADARYAVVGADARPDWSDARAVDALLAETRPGHVIVAAGRTAGIAGNQRFPADLMVDNLLVAAHVIPAAWRQGVGKLLYLSSSCTYPLHAPHPWRTESLWTGPVEPTSAAYATAKLAGLRLCEAYRQQHGANFVSAIAADVFGPGDDFGTDGSGHVVGALMARMHAAKVAGLPEVTIWGSGDPRREFLYVDDFADAVLFVMQTDEEHGPINIGTGVTTSIRELALMLRAIVGFGGELRFDTTKPDGMPEKGLDSTSLRARGWAPSRTLRAALEETYAWFLAHDARQPS